jgi:hypothetical protein
MKLYLSRFRQNEKNTIYETVCDVQTFDDLRKAVSLDHIAAKMRGDYRKNDNFLSSSCIMLDCDNSHSDEREDWKTPDDVADAFPDVKFWYIYSRNHMKPKAGKEPRPKFHCYFPLSKIYTDFTEYERFMLTACGLFPFFDAGASKPAQYFNGVADPDGGEMSGGAFLDSYLAAVDTQEVTDSVKDYKEEFGEFTDETRKAFSRLYSYLGIEKPPDEQKQDPAELVARGHRHDYVIRRLGEFIGLLRGAADAETVYSMLYSDFQQHCEEPEDPPEEQFRKEWMPTVKKYLKEQAAAEKDPGFYSYARKAWEAEHPGQEFNSDWAAARAAALRAKEAGEEFDLTGGRTYTTDIKDGAVIPKEPRQRIIADSAAELVEMEIPPVEWLVDNFLPIGSACLAAPPKSYKSYLAIDLCLSICLGVSFLGRKTNKASCLYFDLESGKRRPRQRIKQILGNRKAPDNFYIITGEADPGKVGDGFEETLMDQLEQHPDIRLVVIDVLQKIRPPSKGKSTAYESDYQLFEPINKIALQKNVAVFCITHTRKGRDTSDPYNNISGSTGILGSVDAAFILDKTKRFGVDDTTLYVTGREMPQQELAVCFNENLFRWEYMGSAEDRAAQRLVDEYHASPIVAAVRELVKKNGGSWEGSAQDLIDYSAFTNRPIMITSSEVGKAVNQFMNLFEGIDSIECVPANTRKRKRIYKFTVT